MGLRILVAVLPRDTQAVMAIPEIIHPQGTLAVLETILLVPLVTMQNRPQATEGCKKRVTHTWRTTVVTCACLSYPSIANSRLFNAQHILSVTQHPAFCHMWFSRILVKSTAAITHSPITLYLKYLLTFDPVLHLFSVSLDVESILPSPLCSSVASPPHTQYIVATPSPGCLQAHHCYLVDLCSYYAGSMSTGWITSCAWPTILNWMEVSGYTRVFSRYPRHVTKFKRFSRTGMMWPISVKERDQGPVGALPSSLLPRNLCVPSRLDQWLCKQKRS